MSIRYIAWLILGIAAAFLVVATAAFMLPVIAALALGVGIGMLLVSLGIAGYHGHLATLAANEEHSSDKERTHEPAAIRRPATSG